MVDSNGYPLLTDITTGNIHDSKCVGNLLKDMYIYYPSIKVIKADKGYLGARLNETEYKIECVKSNSGTSEFRPLEGRWVVERTFSWHDNYRRLCRNYERYLTIAKTMAYFASILFLLRYFYIIPF